MTHAHKSKPYVYLQLLPESTPFLKDIDAAIDRIIEDNQHSSSYQIGDHVIARFTDDEYHYRARIESHTSASDTYAVFFLDFGNIDEDVPVDHIYPCPEELKSIEPQAHGYLLADTDADTWEVTVQSWLADEKLNSTVEFQIVDGNESVIRMNFVDDDESEVNEHELTSVSYTESTNTLMATVSGVDKDCFYIHLLSDADEIAPVLQTCEKVPRTADPWAVGDLCLVSNDDNQSYRGQVLAMHENTYDVRCLDYGHVLHNRTSDQLYAVPDEGIFQRAALARQCRLHDVDANSQSKAIEDVIQHIPASERLTITVENDLDAPCLSVVLARENHDIVNDHYLTSTDATGEDEAKVGVLLA